MPSSTLLRSVAASSRSTIRMNGRAFPVSTTRTVSTNAPSSSDSDYGAPRDGPSGASNSVSQGISSYRAVDKTSGRDRDGIAQQAFSTDSSTGMSEEAQPGVGDIHQPADKPAGEKAKQTLEQGNKKLDPADG